MHHRSYFRPVFACIIGTSGLLLGMTGTHAIDTTTVVTPPPEHPGCTHMIDPGGPPLCPPGIVYIPVPPDPATGTEAVARARWPDTRRPGTADFDVDHDDHRSFGNTDASGTGRPRSAHIHGLTHRGPA